MNFPSPLVETNLGRQPIRPALMAIPRGRGAKVEFIKAIPVEWTEKDGRFKVSAFSGRISISRENKRDALLGLQSEIETAFVDLSDAGKSRLNAEDRELFESLALFMKEPDSGFPAITDEERERFSHLPQDEKASIIARQSRYLNLEE